jgi:glycosyltransferase involved in cell wall biosynthesis
VWPRLLKEGRRITRQLLGRTPSLWLTYHSYYKAPDVLGPAISRHLNIPYVLFQGIYATKRRRRLRTLPGFYLNRAALYASSHVFTNKRVDLKNLRRIIPENRLTYIRPGIDPDDFCHDAAAAVEQRREWQVGTDPVVLSAAMFRSDVKTRGLLWLIRACGRLLRSGRRFYLVIAGEGREKQRLTRAAQQHLPGRVRFVGKIPRSRMFRFYSAGELFAFPGIGESLGMVYLEAQSCGLPVVAFDNSGIPEVVRHDTTGYLVPSYAEAAFVQAMDGLLERRELRLTMGRVAARHVRRHHDLKRNYREMERVLLRIVRNNHRRHI